MLHQDIFSGTLRLLQDYFKYMNTGAGSTQKVGSSHANFSVQYFHQNSKILILNQDF